MDFLFNRNRLLFVINKYTATYLGTDCLSHLSRKSNLSTCSQRFHHQMQCNCLLHPENYNWPKHTDFLFNRNKLLFVINQYSATYVGTNRLSHLNRRCNLYTYRCSHHEREALHMYHHRHSWNNSQSGKHSLFRKRNKYCTKEAMINRVDSTRDPMVTIIGPPVNVANR
jgi:hypothetical protein